MVIRHLHKCEPTHLKTVHVTEVFEGKTIWDGDVEVFILTHHPKAIRCYGWSYGEPEQFIIILHLSPVNSPESAVKVGIAHQVKEAKKGFET